jgi:predicted exporter
MRLAAAAVLLALLATLVAKAVRVQSDFTAFLPESTTTEQRLLVAQLRDGFVSRLMLVALEGAEPEKLAAASRKLAADLAAAPEFAFVSNGATLASAGLLDKLLAQRYALSPAVTRDAFTAEGLRRALEERLAELSAPFASPTRRLLPRDPTAELAAIAKALLPQAQPATRDGVWFDAAGKRALLVAQTRAPGFDSVAQEAAIQRVRQAAADPAVRVTLTGPGVFAAESHRVIERDVEWLGFASIGAVLALLLYVYRSPAALVLVATPVALGLLAGVLAVQLVFGSVHAITLGFGATLVGEAVDYPNYVLVQAQGGERDALQRVGGTLALAVLTTVASALALALSGFKGLAQLGVLTMAGILVAGIATRWLVPWLARGQVPRAHALPLPPGMPALRSPLARGLSLLAAIAAVAALATAHPDWRERDLASLSPIPAELRARDAELRSEMGAPEVSYLVATRGATEDEALAAAEALRPALERAREQGLVRGFDSPAALLPSAATQRARLDALPPREGLAANLRAALQGLPFKADVFAPFLADVEAARSAPPVTRATYAGTPLAAKLDALVVTLDDTWLTLTPLSGVRDAGRLAETLASVPGARLVNLKEVSTDMVDGYLHASLSQVALGAALIAALLAVGLHSVRRAWHVAFPNLAALAITAGLLVAFGVKLSVFHLVALLLVLGIGLNYALFLEAAGLEPQRRDHVRQALALCVATTVITFGILAASSTPVLRAIGATVALGALMALLLAAVWARPAATRQAA